MRLSGIVEYRAGEIECFQKPRTIIDPGRDYPIPYTRLYYYLDRGQLEIVGTMPADFCERITAAVRAKKEWRQAQRDYFFKWFPRCS